MTKLTFHSTVFTTADMQHASGESTEDDGYIGTEGLENTSLVKIGYSKSVCQGALMKI